MTTIDGSPRFHVQATATDPRDGFPYHAHHDSVSALWFDRWRRPAAGGFYPFGEGAVEDFEPVMAGLVAASGDDPSFLDRPDEYARPFLPVGDDLTTRAEKTLAGGDTTGARALFLRAAAVYRIARFPIVRSQLGREAWEKGKAAYEQGARLLDPPIVPVEVPFAHADPDRGDVSRPIPAYLRLPAGTAPDGGWPVVLVIAGLDGYRTDLTDRGRPHLERGRATLTFEIPGTGDCPASAEDPESADRLLSSVLDWVAGEGHGRGLDKDTVVAHGLSTGGYYAIRAAHTHRDRLVAAVAQGGGAHHMFDPEWVRAQDQMEYPFALAEALAWKFGYRDDDPATAVERYAEQGRKFSLLDSGVLATPACRLLVVNGAEDSIFPVEDSVLAATAGTGTDLVVLGNRAHMGFPEADPVLFRWLDDVLKSSR